MQKKVKRVIKLIYRITNPKQMMKVLKSISNIKAKPLTENESRLLKELKQAVKEMKWVMAGKLKARPIEDLLNQL